MSDNRKDIQNNDAMSVFLNGHETRFNTFGGNRAGERAYRRAERLAGAIFLIISHLPEEDVLKTHIRTEAVGLLTAVLSSKDSLRQDQPRSAQVINGRVRMLMSCVKLLAISGSISSQNANILLEALDEFGLFIATAQKSQMADTVRLSKEDLLDVSGEDVRSESRTKRIKDKVSIKDGNTMSDIDKDSVRGDSGNGVRARNILNVLKTGGSLGIKDIAANLPEYSEKMIQRELLALVSGRKVVKVGLKRWSKYSLSE